MTQAGDVTRNTLAEDFLDFIGDRLDRYPPASLHPRLAEEENTRLATVTLERDKLKERLGGGRAAYEAVDPFESAVYNVAALVREASYLLGLSDGLQLAGRIDSGIIPWIVEAWVPQERGDEEKTE